MGIRAVEMGILPPHLFSCSVSDIENILCVCSFFQCPHKIRPQKIQAIFSSSQKKHFQGKTATLIAVKQDWCSNRNSQCYWGRQKGCIVLTQLISFARMSQVQTFFLVLFEAMLSAVVTQLQSFLSYLIYTSQYHLMAVLFAGSWISDKERVASFPCISGEKKKNWNLKEVARSWTRRTC